MTPAGMQDAMIEPRPGLIADLDALDGDIVILGAAGKMGPTITHLAARAVAASSRSRRIIAVSRFTEPRSADALAADGVEIHRADVADEAELARLPDAENVVYLLGTKFGTSGAEAQTWATNAYLAGRVAERYGRSRIVALSTGNVYPLVPVGSGGPTEDHAVGPVGEYAMTCLGRERIFSHFSERLGTRISLIRLNYAVEMRYGVIVDVAQRVHDERPVDLAAGQVNVVWQGYAAEVILRALARASSPPTILNLTGPETISVRQLATRLGALMGKDVTFAGAEGDRALLSDASQCHRWFGYPSVPLGDLIDATATWVMGGGETLGKPTKFDRTDGKF